MEQFGDIMQNKDLTFDTIIVGAGHAGVEAAWAASQFDLNIGLITLEGVDIASTPCNPSIGGVGKGQVVRELDAMGGLMPRIADLAGIQYRTLNESKGYAVQSTRVQVDREMYSKYALELLSQCPNIKIIKDKVINISRDDDKNYIITSESANKYLSKSLIMTLGTFLNGKTHIGSEVKSGGRYDMDTSSSINDLMSNIKTINKRFKTGTPARLNSETIDFSKLEEQPSDMDTENFHFNNLSTNARNLRQVSCYIAYTNKDTIDVISNNLEESPMFNGQINAIGARYCPSIEDKVHRYPQKHKHHVFIEPEGLNSKSIYPSGISSSLPKDVQKHMIHSIEGLEDSEILKYGYAVEYDVLDTSYLSHELEHKEYPNLYFAGQVNGTSGYEEAAAQGLIAGISASLKILGRPSFYVKREDSYIGVLVDDLVSTQRDEPYRLFTARSENRLLLREDNAYVRMYGYRKSLNLNKDTDFFLDRYYKCFSTAKKIINGYSFKGFSLKEQIKQSINPVDFLLKFFKEKGLVLPFHLIKTLAIDVKYEGYISKDLQKNSKIQSLMTKRLNLDAIMNSENVSFECKQRILKTKPQTMRHLKEIEGIRQASVVFIANNKNFYF